MLEKMENNYSTSEEYRKKSAVEKGLPETASWKEIDDYSNTGK